MTLRQVTPSVASVSPMKVNGRTYTCAVGSAITVPDFDAVVLEANGWTGIPAGTTAQRPSDGQLAKGTEFYDTTVGAIVHFDGKVWRNLTTGASV